MDVHLLDSGQLTTKEHLPLLVYSSLAITSFAVIDLHHQMCFGKTL